MMRSSVLLIAGVALVCGVTLLFAGIPPALVAVFWGAVIVLSIVYERFRYKPVSVLQYASSHLPPAALHRRRWPAQHGRRRGPTRIGRCRHRIAALLRLVGSHAQSRLLPARTASPRTRSGDQQPAEAWAALADRLAAEVAARGAN